MAGLEITAGEHVPEITTSKLPASPIAGLVMVSIELVTLEYGAVLVRDTPPLRH